LIRVNLIRERAQRPPTIGERLSGVLLALLVVAYLLTVIALLATRRTADHALLVLEKQARAEKKLLARPAEQYAVYTAGDLAAVKSLERIVSLQSRKLNWALKLAALQRCLPEGVVVSSFEGDSTMSLKVRAYALDADHGGLRRVRELIHGLGQDAQFMKGLGEIRLLNVSASRTAEAGERIYFTFECPAAPDEAAPRGTVVAALPPPKAE